MINCPHCNHNTLYVSPSKSLIRCTVCGKDVEKSQLESLLSLKKGKVVICTVHGRTFMDGVDRQLLAVGKPKGKTYFQWWNHVPGLAPSRELVTFTKEHNRSKGHLEGWFERYTESLLDEWEVRGDSIHALTQLLGWLKNGETVAISCYCDSSKREFCHLSILKDIIEDLGYEVEEAEPIKYK